MATKLPIVLDATGKLQQIQSGDTVPLAAGGTGATTAAGAKAALALDSVENKSSATIRGEITSANVTAALGYTPTNAVSGITTGTTTIDFGLSSAGGKNEVDLVLTGLSSISAGSIPNARIEVAASSSHTANDHKYAALFIGLSCDTVVAGTGFTLHARASEKLTGVFNVRWWYF